jgi:hypothetical protein
MQNLSDPLVMLITIKEYWKPSWGQLRHSSPQPLGLDGFVAHFTKCSLIAGKPFIALVWKDGKIETLYAPK